MGYSAFSPNGLAQVVRAGDSRRFGIDLKNDRDAIISSASANALAGLVKLETYSSTPIRGGVCVSYPQYEQSLVLRSIARQLKKRLRIRMPDRNKAVRGVITSLLDSTPMIVIRCDVSSFYESVSSDNLRDNLVYDTAHSSAIRSYLDQYFTVHCPPGLYGIPRGTGLSAVLAEIAMRKFDDDVRSIPTVYRYFRFADDIIVFITGGKESTFSKMRELLPKGMHFNRKKTEFCDLTGGPIKEGDTQRPLKSLNYLGYKFDIEDESGRSRFRKVDVGISDIKIKRLKSKMLLSFKQYQKDFDARLLLDRITFLSSNYKVKRSGNTHIKGSSHIKSGIYYNYHLCGSYKVGRKYEYVKGDAALAPLMGLDGMLKSLIKGKSEFKWQIDHYMPRRIRADLLRLSYSRGFRDKMLCRITPDRISVIKRAWRNA